MSRAASGGTARGRRTSRAGRARRHRGATARGTLLVASCLALGLAVAGAARAEGPSAQVVAVLASHDSRLADEIRRELESSKFEVLSADLGGRPWQEVARLVDGGRLLRGVAVEPSDRTLTVYTRLPGGRAVDVRLALSLDPADRMARRHACLSVVEFLHALGESDAAAASESARGPASAAPPKTGLAPAGGQATAVAGTAAATTSAGPELTPASPSPVLLVVTPPPRVGWQLGAGTTFDLETGAGEPTSHLQFLGRFPTGRHLSLCARLLWPLLAAQYRTSGGDVRYWTFAGGGSLQYAFAPGQRLRPYVGLALGARFGLVETTLFSGTQTSPSLTVSGTFGIELGVRYSLRPLLEVFFQLEAARNWLIPPPDKGDVIGDPAANGEVARVAVGITFDS